jgi:biopolymer transport protein ExbD
VKFRKNTPAEPEINLIPFIDILLVVVIFLMLSTTWSKLTEINLSLPVANDQKQTDKPKQIILSVSAQGAFAVNKMPVPGRTVAALVNALTPLADKGTILVISADAASSHQSVVNAMEAARRSGLSQLTFATQSSEVAEF